MEGGDSGGGGGGGGGGGAGGGQGDRATQVDPRVRPKHMSTPTERTDKATMAGTERFEEGPSFKNIELDNSVPANAPALLNDPGVTAAYF